MYETIPSSKSNELTIDAYEILKQIKKQADEISTSEGSIPILKNLSNPTNLTNPQILGTHKSNTNIESSQTPSFTKKNISKISKRTVHNVKSQPDVLRNELFKRKKYLNYMLFKNNNKNNKRISLKNDDINTFLDNNIKNDLCLTTKRKLKLHPIWENLENKNNTLLKEKDIRLNIRKYALTRKYIDSCKGISQIKYNINLKKEIYQQLINLKEDKLLTTKKTEEKIQQLKKYLENHFNENYIQNLKHLNDSIEKEQDSLYALNNNIIMLKDDIDKLNKQISKLKGKKINILNWIELQIQLKERIKNLPFYYFKILEENDHYKIYDSQESNHSLLNSKNDAIDSERISISEQSRNKILNYRYTLIYKNPEEFMAQFDNLQIRWLQDLNKYQKIIKEIELMKNKISEISGMNLFEDEKSALDKLKLVKNIYINLKYQYNSLEEKNKKILKKINLDKSIKRSKSVLSSPDIYSNIYNEMFNNFNIYNIKTTDINKRKSPFSSHKENYSNSNIYYLILNIFNVVKQNNFMKFDESNFVKNRNINPIFAILHYIEIIFNLLIEEKNKYLNDPKLRDKYKYVQIIFIKERKKLNLLKLIEKNELKRKEKINIINEKIRRSNHHLNKKIDFSSYTKLNKIKLSQEKNNLKEEKKYIPNFEDFLYD